MSAARRVVLFPPVRIVLFAAPIILFTSLTTQAAAALHWGAHSVVGVLVPLVCAAGALLLYVALVRFIERRRADELDRRGAVAEAARGFVVGAALFSATMAVLLVVGAAAVVRGDGWRALVAGFTFAVMAGVGEEILFRAIFFRIVEESLGTWIALASSAALFGLMHAFNPGADVVSVIAIALEAGVLLAAAYVLTRRLWMAIGLHVAWNFTEGALFGASVSGSKVYGLFHSRFGGPKILTGGAFGPEASIVAIVVCLAAGIALTVRAHRRGRFVAPYWRRW